ncbi:MAG: acyltransferase, partial [Candidatus Omnitrophota bacterium]
IHDKCIILFPNLIQIGSRSSLARYVELNPGPGQAPCLIIGEDTWIGPYCFFRTANHKFDNLDELFIKQGHDEKKIILGNDIYVGAHCIFLGGTEIGDHSIIAAGSVVSIKVPSYSVVAGNPARVIRKRK